MRSEGDGTTRLRFSSQHEWETWCRANTPLSRRLRARLPPSEPLLLAHSGHRPSRVLVVVDALTSASRAAVVAPALRMAETMPVDTLVPSSMVTNLPAVLRNEVERADSPSRLSPTVVLSTSPHMQAGARALAWARGRKIPYLIVQHGAITPFSPPLPKGVELLAWTELDARMWTEGLDTPVHVIGSQLLWEAAQGHRAQLINGPVVFLGQLHAAELDREVTIRTVETLAATTSLVYRPHPAERDRRSRAQHRRWRRAGLAIDERRATLLETNAAVVGIFSTGLLEAAAAGLPVCGACVPPVRWVQELWERYEIPEWGSGRVAAFTLRPRKEPILAITEIVASHAN